MKVIIAGCRDYEPTYDELDSIVKASGFLPTIILNGCCPSGVDFIVWRWALSRYYGREAFPAAWTRYGRAAGPFRNQQMALAGEALIAIWDQKSRGTKSMIEEMKKLGKPIHLYYITRNG